MNKDDKKPSHTVPGCSDVETFIKVIEDIVNKYDPVRLADPWNEIAKAYSDVYNFAPPYLVMMDMIDEMNKLISFLANVYKSVIYTIKWLQLSVKEDYSSESYPALECDIPNETESVTEVDTVEMDRIAQRIDQGIGELEEINDEYDRVRAAHDTFIAQNTIIQEIASTREDNQLTEGEQTLAQAGRRAIVSSLGVDPNSEEGQSYIEEVTDTPVSTEDAEKQGLGKRLVESIKNGLKWVLAKITEFGRFIKKVLSNVFGKLFKETKENIDNTLLVLNENHEAYKVLLEQPAKEDANGSSYGILMSNYVWDYRKNDFINLNELANSRVDFYDVAVWLRDTIEKIKGDDHLEEKEIISLAQYPKQNNKIYIPNQGEVSIRNVFNNHSLLDIKEESKPLTQTMINVLKQLREYSAEAEAKFNSWEKAFDQYQSNIESLANDAMKRTDEMIDSRIKSATDLLRMLTMRTLKYNQLSTKIAKAQHAFSKKINHVVESVK